MSNFLADSANVPGATRDEERLQGLLAGGLGDAGYAGLRTIRVDVCNGTIALSGCVSSYYLKQLAQEIVLRFDRSREVNNAIRVSG